MASTAGLKPLELSDEERAVLESYRDSKEFTTNHGRVRRERLQTLMSRE
jgi:hypothetical protein